MRRIFLGPNGIRAGWRLLFFLVLLFLFGQGFRIAVERLANFKGSPEWNAVDFIITEGLTFVAVLLAAWIMTRIERRRWSFANYGFSLHAYRALFLRGVLWGFAIPTLLVIILFLSGGATFHGLALPGRELAIFTILWSFAMLGVGLAEEAFFRSYPLFTLATGIGFWPASILLSALFGLLHYLFKPMETWMDLLSVTLIGLFLCLTFRRTKSLWFAIGFHAAFDFAALVLFAARNTGNNGQSIPGHLLDISYAGPDWLTGGPVGLEASALIFPMLVGLFLLFHRRYQPTDPVSEREYESRSARFDLAWLLLLLIGILGSVARASFPSETLPSGNSVALTSARIYQSPASPLIANGTVLINNGRIMAVGRSADVVIPPNYRIVDCSRLFITAGYQNSHVHFTETKWQNAARSNAAKLAKELQEFLTRYGFTTVLDTGSMLDNTIALRNRILSGEIPGPRILTSGQIIFPKGGIPYYAKNALDAMALKTFPQPSTALEAQQAARNLIASGADLIKLYTVSYVTRKQTVAMSVDIAKAAAEEAHSSGKLVFVHPSTQQGMEIAIAAGADVLAHSIEQAPDWSEQTAQRLRSSGIAIIPTLQLFYGDKLSEGIGRLFGRTNLFKQIESFSHIGGRILFGTDAGYISTYDPTSEYALMRRAGLGFAGVLSSLTTAPAEMFGESTKRGRIIAGMEADLVVLSADPAQDVRFFSRVKYAIRGGKFLYAAHPPIIEAKSATGAFRIVVVASLLGLLVWFVSHSGGRASVPAT